MTQSARMPAVFIGHGGPMNALDTNIYTSSWRAFGSSIRRPNAILAVSAHWYINGTAVTAMVQPRTLHDFYANFNPPALFEFDYPAPGSPELAKTVLDLLHPPYGGLDVDSWGLDHGTWSVLAHAFPKADIPVVQLSLDFSGDFGSHFDLGTKLAKLRDDDVLVVTSGNIVHNLRAIDPGRRETGFDWGERFDADVRSALIGGSPRDLLTFDAHADFALAAPTPEHFLPLLYFAGMAQEASEDVKELIGGFVYGGFSMASYVLE